LRKAVSDVWVQIDLTLNPSPGRRGTSHPFSSALFAGSGERAKGDEVIMRDKKTGKSICLSFELKG
jgi:hypothetical protein